MLADAVAGDLDSPSYSIPAFRTHARHVAREVVAALLTMPFGVSSPSSQRSTDEGYRGVGGEEDESSPTGKPNPI